MPPRGQLRRELLPGIGRLGETGLMRCLSMGTSSSRWRVRPTVSRAKGGSCSSRARREWQVDLLTSSSWPARRALVHGACDGLSTPAPAAARRRRQLSGDFSTVPRRSPARRTVPTVLPELDRPGTLTCWRSETSSGPTNHAGLLRFSPRVRDVPCSYRDLPRRSRRRSDPLRIVLGDLPPSAQPAG